MSNDSKLFAEFPPISTKEWEDVIVKDLKGADYEKKLVWKTTEGFKVKPYYRKEDLESISYLQCKPGEFPYTRGDKAVNNHWEVRQDFKIKDINKCNALAKQAAQKGVQSVGLCASTVENLTQMEALLFGIDPIKTGMHFICSKSYEHTLDLFVQFLEKSKIDTTKVYGSINFDPIHFALTHGDFYESFEKNIIETKNIFTKFAKKLPNFRLITINAGCLHNSGSSIIQELGFGLAWANEYLVQLTQNGLGIDEIAPRIGFSFAMGSNYFMEIAKIRAARMLWAQIVKQYHPTQEKSCCAFIHAVSSSWNKSTYDPYVNLLRSTTETMSSAIGGADSINVTPFSEAFQDMDDFSARIARNQQIILKEESFMDKIADPAAGSYYVENLTDSIAQYSWKNFLTVEDMGGFNKAFESDFIQIEVEKSALAHNTDMATRKIVLTGVNQFPNLTESMLDEIKVSTPCACASKVVAKHKKLQPYRGAEAFESLRLETEKHAQKNGKRPKVFLLTYGNLSMRKARAGFATNFFGCAGYEIIDNAGFKTPIEGAQAALNAKADVVVLCSSDEEYAELVSATCPELQGKTKIVVAGFPKDSIDDFKKQGVEEFIHVKSNVLEILQNCQKQLLK
ncbi:MAG: methylmalonyl-CoA mutase family protein [Bacteroidales bacterium]